MPETIYSQPNAFYLNIQGVDHLIREPIGWNKAKININRDKVKHGVNVDFPSKKLKVDFGLTPHPTSGLRSKTLIDDEVELNGPESEIILKFGTITNNVFTVITTRRLELIKGFIQGAVTTTASLIDESFKTRVKDYYDIPVSLTQTQTVLNNPMPGGVTPSNLINLHSKALRKTFRAESRAQTAEGATGQSGDALYSLAPAFGDTDVAYGSLSLPNVVNRGLLESFSLPITFSNISPVDEEDNNVPRPNFQSVEIIELVSIKVRARYRITVSKGTGDNNVIFRTVLKYGNATNFIGGTTVFLFAGGGDAVIQIDHTATIPITGFDPLITNSPFFFWIEVDNSASVARDLEIITLTTFENDKASFYQLIGDTYFKPSEAEGYFIFDALDYVFRAITEDLGCFKSTLYTSGQARNIIATNGNRIRKNDEALKAPTFSAEDAYKSLEMTHAIGEVFEFDANTGKQFVRWERVDYFYQDVEILNLVGRTGDYEVLEEIEEKAFPNLVQMTYPRLTVREDNGSNTIDEFNSDITVTLPLKRSNGKVRLKSMFRTSGYDSETSRRLQDRPTESFRSDDDIFLFHVLSQFNESGINMLFAFDDSDDENQLFIYFIQQDFEDHFRYISRIIVSGDTNTGGGGSFNTNGEYVYDPTLYETIPVAGIIVDGMPNTEVFIKVPATTTSTIGNVAIQERVITIQTQSYLAERNENFTTLTGIIDPPSVYNLRFHPLRIFVNHGLMVNRALFYQPDTAEYRTQFKRENRDLVTQLNSIDPNPLGDTSNAVMNEATGIQKQNNDQGRFLVRPKRVKFTAEITASEIITAMNAFTLENDVRKNGYITTLNNKGEEIQVYIDSIEGPPLTNYYEIEGRIKGNYYD